MAKLIEVEALTKHYATIRLLNEIDPGITIRKAEGNELEIVVADNMEFEYIKTTLQKKIAPAPSEIIENILANDIEVDEYVIEIKF